MAELQTRTPDSDLESNRRERPHTEGNETRLGTPPVDIYEREDAFLVVADMPGLTPESIDIELDNDKLSIEATSNIDGLDPVRYERVFRVVRGLDPEGVEAKYDTGVLTVTLPKPTSHVPRRITVTSG